MKKFLRILMLTICILMVSIPVFATEFMSMDYFNSLYDTTIANGITRDDIRVQLNGEIVDFTDENGNKVEPQIVNDRTMVPMRKIFEVFGADVIWDGTTRSIKANTEELVIGLQIDNSIATVTNKSGEVTEIKLDSAPVIINDRTLVPVRFIAESLDKKVGWDAYNRAVIIIDTSFIEDTLKEKTSNLYDYLTLEAVNMESFDMNVALNGKFKQSAANDSQSISLNGDMDIKLNENLMYFEIDLDLSGTGYMKELLKSENVESVEIKIIMDYENKELYIYSPLIKEYEGKWIKYGLDEDGLEEFNYSMELMKNQKDNSLKLLIDSLILEDFLTLTTYDSIQEFMQVITSIFSNENFKVSGTNVKNYSFELDLNDVIKLFLSDMDSEYIEEFKELFKLDFGFDVVVEDNIAKESNLNIDFEAKEDEQKVDFELIVNSVLKSFNEAVKINLPSENKIVDMNAIQEESAYLAAQQAQFMGFAREMAEIAEMVDFATIMEKGNQVQLGNARSDAQLYNYVARGGKYAVTAEINWLVRSDAAEIPCTLISKEFAKDVLGRELPNRYVETYKGTNQELSYFVTPKGEVFCWPPYIYDGKSYVNDETTVKDEDGNEIAIESTKNNLVKIYFEKTGETVIVSNKANVKPSEYTRGKEKNDGVGVWYYKEGAVEGIDFSKYTSANLDF